MSAEHLLDALDKLGKSDFKTFKWYLTQDVLDGCKPVPGHRLEDAERTDTVSVLSQSYGDATAVTLAVTVLRKMNHNAAAQALEKTCTESGGGAADSSPTSSSAAPAASSTMTAKDGGIIVVPNVSSSQGTWNVTVNNTYKS